MSTTVLPDYNSLAATSVKLYEAYVASNPALLPVSATSSRLALEPKTAADAGRMDFEVDIPPAEDRFVFGNFVEGTWVGKLESTKEGEQGLYNVAIDPSPRTPYAVILPTKGYHPQSAPLRPGYLVHAYKLLVALEEQLAKASVEPRKVVAVYDCGEKSGAVQGHKCIRLYVVDDLKESPIPLTTYPVPGPDSPALLSTFVNLLSTPLANGAPAIPLRPHYNLILTRESLSVAQRSDDGWRGAESGRWDGARLIGVEL